MEKKWLHRCLHLLFLSASSFHQMHTFTERRREETYEVKWCDSSALLRRSITASHALKSASCSSLQLQQTCRSVAALLVSDLCVTVRKKNPPSVTPVCKGQFFEV